MDALRPLEGTGAIDFESDRSSLIVDLSKAPYLAQAVRAATGFQSLHKPIYISRSMYQRLKQLEADPKQLDRILGPHVPPEAIEVAKLRLVEMVAHADMLAAHKRVLSDEFTTMNCSSNHCRISLTNFLLQKELKSVSRRRLSGVTLLLIAFLVFSVSFNSYPTFR